MKVVYKEARKQRHGEITIKGTNLQGCPSNAKKVVKIKILIKLYEVKLTADTEAINTDSQKDDGKELLHMGSGQVTAEKNEQ